MMDSSLLEVPFGTAAAKCIHSTINQKLRHAVTSACARARQVAIIRHGMGGLRLPTLYGFCVALRQLGCASSQQVSQASSFAGAHTRAGCAELHGQHRVQQFRPPAA